MDHFFRELGEVTHGTASNPAQLLKSSFQGFVVGELYNLQVRMGKGPDIDAAEHRVSFLRACPPPQKRNPSDLMTSSRFFTD